MAGDGDQVKTIHTLLLAFPVPTHLTPLLQLARRLSSFSPATHRFVFTSIVSYATASAVAGQANSIVPAGGGSAGHDDEVEFTVRTIAVPDGLPLSHPRSHMVDLIQASQNMKAPTERFIQQLQQTHPPLSCIVSDIFVEWAPLLASSFSLPLFSFFTSNASACCVMSHAPSLVSQGIIPFLESSQHEPIPCPGVPPLLPKEFPISMQLQDVSLPQLQFTMKMFSRLEESAGLILNTCRGLEPDAIKTLQVRCPVYTVGPLFLPTMGARPDHGSAKDCLTWLDAQAPSSVLYVSFGTRSTFSAEQLKELAMGLEDTKLPVLWVSGGSMSDVLPDGFLERTKDRCFVTSWAPQLHVLNHISVGGFFTHCGWNSMLENFTLNGVPMLCWPDKAEQGVNARLLVDVWKLGMHFKPGKNHNISRGEVEAAVRALMQGKEAEKMRKRGKELKEVVEKSLKQEGSSHTNLEDLLRSVEGSVC